MAQRFDEVPRATPAMRARIQQLLGGAPPRRSTPTTTQERHMSTNPYDRRARGRNTAQAGGEGFMLGSYDTQVLTPGLEIEDLHALAHSARMRGVRETDKRASESHRAEVDRARREAWAEGFAAGEPTGSLRMLAQVDEAVGARARDSAELGRRVVFRATAEGSSPVTKADLLRELTRAVETLEHLVKAHHDGFPVEVEL